MSNNPVHTNVAGLPLGLTGPNTAIGLHLDTSGTEPYTKQRHLSCIEHIASHDGNKHRWTLALIIIIIIAAYKHPTPGQRNPLRMRGHRT